MKIGALSAAEAQEAGLIANHPASRPIGPWDRIDGADIPPRDQQPDDIWENENGIYSLYQPHTIARTEPRLAGPINMWRSGVREIGLYEYRKLSAFEISAILVMSAADYRRRHPPEKRDGK